MSTASPFAPPTRKSSARPPDGVELRRVDGQPLAFRLPVGATTIGSGPKCSLRIEGDGVRPLHCVISHDERGMVVRRWAAETMLNGAAFSESILKIGDRLTIASIDLVVTPPPAGADPPLACLPDEPTTEKPRATAPSNKPERKTDPAMPLACVEAAIKSPAKPLSAVPAHLLKPWLARPEPSAASGVVAAGQGFIKHAAAPAASEPPATMPDELESPAAGAHSGASSATAPSTDEARAAPQAVVSSSNNRELRSRAKVRVNRLAEAVRNERSTAEELRASLAATRSEAEAAAAERNQAEQMLAAVRAELESAQGLAKKAVELSGKAQQQEAYIRELEGEIVRLEQQLKAQAESAAELRQRITEIEAAVADQTAAGLSLDSAAPPSDGEWLKPLEGPSLSGGAFADKAPATEQGAIASAEPKTAGEDLWNFEAPSSGVREPAVFRDEALTPAPEAEDFWGKPAEPSAAALSAEPMAEPIEEVADPRPVAEAPASSLWAASSGPATPPPPQNRSVAPPAASADAWDIESSVPEPPAAEWSVEPAASVEPPPPVDEQASEESPCATPSEQWLEAFTKSTDNDCQPGREPTPAEPIAPADSLAEGEQLAEGVGGSVLDEIESLATNSEHHLRRRRPTVAEYEAEAEAEAVAHQHDSAPHVPVAAPVAPEAPAPAAEQAGFEFSAATSSDELIPEQQPTGEAPVSFIEQFRSMMPEDDELPAVEPSAAQPMAPATAGPVEPASPGEREGEDDQSIEDYMAGLMSRIRGEASNGDAAPAPKPPPKPAKAPPAEIAAEPAPPSAPVEAQIPAEPPKPALITDLSDLKRRQAPEQNRDMSALRAVANSSARSALGVADNKQYKDKAVANLAISGMAMGCAAFLGITAEDLLSTQFYIGVAGFGWGAFWAFQTLQNMAAASKAKAEARGS